MWIIGLDPPRDSSWFTRARRQDGLRFVTASDHAVTGASAAHGTAAPERTAANPYRYDLDGLRGIAIGLVVVYHVWFGRVSGGVDIFLVLSGFFFTGMLVRRATASGGPSVVEVIKRTVRRLVPALALVLLVTAIVVAVTRPITQWRGIGDQLIASILYFQNWQLAWTQSDYAAADASVSPLQHLWSMSVQGQFYLLALLVIAAIAWGCRRTGRIGALVPVLTVVVATGTVASFVYATLESNADQARAYYDSGARLWELLAGALLALVIHRVSLPLLLRRLLALAGFVVVLGCGIVIDGGAEFPGPLALVPVGAALALILAGAGPGRQPYIVGMLARKPFVELGAIAYALYLWHWPLFVFYLYAEGGDDVDLVQGLGIVFASLVLAWLTNRYVEKPFTAREKPRGPALYWRRALTPIVALMTVAVLAVPAGWTWYLSNHVSTTTEAVPLDPRTHPGALTLIDGVPTPKAPVAPSVLQAPSDYPQPTVDGCITEFNHTDVLTCAYGDVESPISIAVIGSSHAEHWMPALDEIGKARGIRMQTYLKMGCPITLGEAGAAPDAPADCRDWSEGVVAQLAIDQPAWVFTTSTRPNPEAPGDFTPPEYIELWARLADLGIPLLAMRDTPWLHDDGVAYSAVDCIADGGTPTTCGMPRDAALSPVDPALVPAAAFPLVFPMDMNDAVCDDRVCRAVQGNVFVYHDAHHLSASYVRTMIPELDRRLGFTTGWW
ncbi:acyltransferase [Rhodococcus rhodnii LMG 5362]|uniref:Acyltransferase n=1 Tax=Rhodococcus rhodnii LMG 5362 TaxID=1273125 RepID=R7WI06_9NOCA|nr:acyltransferase [Rhodococcus rhodnii LMG 5362]